MSYTDTGQHLFIVQEGINLDLVLGVPIMYFITFVTVSGNILGNVKYHSLHFINFY